MNLALPTPDAPKSINELESLLKDDVKVKVAGKYWKFFQEIQSHLPLNRC